MAADPYSILGVARGAGEKDIKSAYRKLAKELHPDRNADNPKATERFSEVTKAYDLLSDKDKRARFDRGEIDIEGNPAMPFGYGGGGGFGGAGQRGFRGAEGMGGFSGAEGIDIGDIFDGLFGGRGGMGGGAAGGARGRAQRPGSNRDRQPSPLARKVGGMRQAETRFHPRDRPAKAAGMNPDQAHDTIPGDDPIATFAAWLEAARTSEPNDANAMALATATSEGRPSVRMVLLKDFGADGFVFYTNARSRKGDEILANPEAALLFHWKSLRRQVRLEGPLAQVDAATADAYFASRSRDSQLGAVASDQSAALDARATFLARVAAAEARFADKPVARPAHWTGFRLAPRAIELWCDRPNRLHERRRFTRRPDGGWTGTLLYP